MEENEAGSAFDRIGKRKRVVAERDHQCANCDSKLAPRVSLGNGPLTFFYLFASFISAFLIVYYFEQVYVAAGAFFIFFSLMGWSRRRRYKECRACGHVVTDAVEPLAPSSSGLGSSSMKKKRGNGLVNYILDTKGERRGWWS
ncbi:MAG: hypothetical protein P1V97_07980 [Planctomycetota bacterium]|nr:hypothetical protein [Planctomycetota bacterium]